MQVWVNARDYNLRSFGSIADTELKHLIFEPSVLFVLLTPTFDIQNCWACKIQMTLQALEEAIEAFSRG
jgi:hypothetical protein